MIPPLDKGRTGRVVIMRTLFLDIETTGLDFDKDKIMEESSKPVVENNVNTFSVVYEFFKV